MEFTISYQLQFHYRLVQDKGLITEKHSWHSWLCRDFTEVLEAVDACLDERYAIDFSPLPPKHYEAIRTMIARKESNVFRRFEG